MLIFITFLVGIRSVVDEDVEVQRGEVIGKELYSKIVVKLKEGYGVLFFILMILFCQIYFSQGIGEYIDVLGDRDIIVKVCWVNNGKYFLFLVFKLLLYLVCLLRI